MSAIGNRLEVVAMLILEKFSRNGIALPDKPAVAPIIESVITFENRYRTATAVELYRERIAGLSLMIFLAFSTHRRCPTSK